MRETSIRTCIHSGISRHIPQDHGRFRRFMRSMHLVVMAVIGLSGTAYGVDPDLSDSSKTTLLPTEQSSSGISPGSFGLPPKEMYNEPETGTGKATTTTTTTTPPAPWSEPLPLAPGNTQKPADQGAIGTISESQSELQTAIDKVKPASVTDIDPKALDSPTVTPGPIPPQPPPPPPGPLKSAGIVVEDLVYDVPMPWGDPDFEAARALYLSNAGKKWLNTIMKGAIPYLTFVEEKILHYKLPQELLYLPVIESEYSPHAVSRSGATGMWQFMQNSISGYGMKITDWVDERRDFMKSTDGALRKLADNYRILGDWGLAIAAYNAGLGAVSRAVAKTGTTKPSIAELGKLGLVSQQALNYVPKFFAVASVLRYPVQHGFPESWGNPETWKALPANQQVDLGLLSELSGIPIDILKKGNPELMKQTTPPGVPEHLIKVPAQHEEVARSVLDNTSRPLIRFHEYTIKAGDTLSAISAKYSTPQKTILDANPGIEADRLRIGAVLKIPAYGTAKAQAAQSAGTATSTVKVKKDEQADTPAQGGTITAGTTDKEPQGQGSKNSMIATAGPPTGQSATTSTSITAVSTTSVTTISSSGTTTTTTTVSQPGNGQTAALSSTSMPAAGTSSAGTPVSNGSAKPEFNGRHTVVKGDTIWNISRRHGITTQELAEANGVGPDFLIKLGQVLKVPSPP